VSATDDERVVLNLFDKVTHGVGRAGGQPDGTEKVIGAGILAHDHGESAGARAGIGDLLDLETRMLLLEVGVLVGADPLRNREVIERPRHWTAARSARSALRARRA